VIIALAVALGLQGPSAQLLATESKDYGGFESAVRSVAFSEDGAYVFGASDSEIIVFDAISGKETARAEVFGPSAVSSRVALRGGIDTFSLGDLPGLTGGKIVKFEQLGYPKSDVLVLAALSADGTGAIVSGIATRSALIVGEKATPFNHEKFSVTSAAVAPQGKAFAIGSLAGEIRVLNSEAKTIFSADAKAGAVVSISFNRQGNSFAIGTGDGSVKIYRNDPWWVKASGACGAMVYGVGWSPEGDLVAAVSARAGGGRVSLLDASSGKTVAKADFATGVYAVGFSNKGDRIAMGCEDGKIRVKAIRR